MTVLLFGKDSVCVYYAKQLEVKHLNKSIVIWILTLNCSRVYNPGEYR